MASLRVPDVLPGSQEGSSGSQDSSQGPPGGSGIPAGGSRNAALLKESGSGKWLKVAEMVISWTFLESRDESGRNRA